MTPAQQPLRHSPGLGRSDCVDHAAASGAAGQQVVAGGGDLSGQRRMGRLVACLCLTVCALAACVAPPREPGSGHLRPDAQPQGKPPALVDAPLLPPQPRPGRKQAEVYSVSVHNVAIRDLLFALARDARLNLDVHPDLAGTVSINAIDQTINEILDRAAMQVDMRYEMEGRNLFVMPDSPVLRHYRVDYPNVAREARSSVSASSSIGSGGGGGGGEQLQQLAGQHVQQPLLGNPDPEHPRFAAGDRPFRARGQQHRAANVSGCRNCQSGDAGKHQCPSGG